jgi:nitric oxide reductase NorD protein
VGDPEGLLIEGARRAAVAARELWWRARSPEMRREVPLARVRLRLELFVTALCGAPYSILPADPPPPPTWLARAMGRAPRHLSRHCAAASTDGAAIWLPRALEASSGDEATIATYRLLAIEQAARAVRGTPSRLPTDRLEEDLYVLAEAVAVECALARDFPGLMCDLRAARAAALRERPPLERLTISEQAVERLLRIVLAAEPAAPLSEIPAAGTPEGSRRWACVAAAQLGARSGRYRGVAVPQLWGQIVAPTPLSRAGPGAGGEDETDPAGPVRRASLRRRPRVRAAAEDEDDDRPGTWMIRADEPMEAAEDPKGLQRPADRDESAAAADLADSLSELPEARVVWTPGTPREILDSDGGIAARRASRRWRSHGDAGVVYPEWDYRTGAYRAHGAVVRPSVATPGSGAWVDAVMTRHAALVRRVRRRFDGLRPRRTRVGRQIDGPEVDLSAYVTAFADRHAQGPGDDRLYTTPRPARRDLAIALLVDISASTDGWVSGGLRIIDVEKEALIVLLEALDALGDRHGAFAFSGEGPSDVRVLIIKGFDERSGMEVRRRVAALEPDRYTRAGAAIRHVSASLAAQPAHHRLLLILSDGKPNDVDGYDGRYGIEDTRQAVAEARLQGLVPFCLTVDREAPRYMPAIFGRGYALLRHQELLPGLLVEVVRRLLAT